MNNYESSTIVDGFTLEMVLEDKAPSPFSLKDFINYLNQTYCTENLAFYQAVTEYRATSQFFFDPTSSKTTIGRDHQEEEPIKLTTTSSSLIPVRLMNGQLFTFQKNQYHLLAPEEQSCFDYMMMQFDIIIDQFIQINANQEINIPADMKQQLLINAHQHHCYHPALLAPACTSILELLRISAFIPFITDPQRLAIFSGTNPAAFSLPSSCSSNITFASSSSTSTSSSVSSSASLASLPSLSAQRPSYFYRSSSHPGQPPSFPAPPPPFLPIPSSPAASATLPWTLRRLKSSPSLNTTTLASPVPPPLPTCDPAAPQPSMSATAAFRPSVDDDDTVSRLSIPFHRPCSIHSQSTDTTTTDGDELKPFLKKWTSPFRRSPSPQNRTGNWRQITVHESPLFKQSCLVQPRPS